MQLVFDFKEWVQLLKWVGVSRICPRRTIAQVHGREDFFFLKLESAVAVFSIAQTVADNLIIIMLCAVEAESMVGKEGKVLIPSYTIFQSRSTPEIPSKADVKKGVKMDMSSPLLSKLVWDESARCHVREWSREKCGGLVSQYARTWQWDYLLLFLIIIPISVRNNLKKGRWESSEQGKIKPRCNFTSSYEVQLTPLI